jgi:hypothetical protein
MDLVIRILNFSTDQPTYWAYDDIYRFITSQERNFKLYR